MVDGDVEDDLATIPLQQLKTICVQMQEAALHAKQPRASVYTGESRSTLYRQREKLKEHDREFAAHPKIDSFFQRTQSGAAPPAPPAGAAASTASLPSPAAGAAAAAGGDDGSGVVSGGAAAAVPAAAAAAAAAAASTTNTSTPAPDNESDVEDGPSLRKYKRAVYTDENLGTLINKLDVFRDVLSNNQAKEKRAMQEARMEQYSGDHMEIVTPPQAWSAPRRASEPR